MHAGRYADGMLGRRIVRPALQSPQHLIGTVFGDHDNRFHSLNDYPLHLTMRYRCAPGMNQFLDKPTAPRLKLIHLSYTNRPCNMAIAPRTTPLCFSDIVDTPFILRTLLAPGWEPSYNRQSFVTKESWISEPRRCIGCVCRANPGRYWTDPLVIEANRAVPLWSGRLGLGNRFIDGLDPLYKGRCYYRKVGWTITSQLKIQDQRGADMPLQTNWRVVRAAFTPITFYFILKLKVLAMRKVKRRYMKTILPDATNIRNKTSQSALGRTMTTATRSPIRRLVIEYLVGAPPHPLWLSLRAADRTEQHCY